MSAINGATKIVGLMGWPISHSFSPPMHNQAFAALGLNWAYIPLAVKPAFLSQTPQSLMSFDFVGCNITIPHKQGIMPHLDEIDPVAKAIGAVNTIAIKEGRSYGYNTDGYGFLASLLEARFDPKDKACLVLGAGGSARAIGYTLAQAGAKEIAIYNRTLDRAQALVADLQSYFGNVPFSAHPLQKTALAEIDGRFDLLVNTTSLGMTPKTEACPWPDELALPEVFVCDLIYNPAQTQLLARAERAGLQGINGLGMLVHQGAKAFEIWTGEKAPTEVMRQALLEALKQ